MMRLAAVAALLLALAPLAAADESELANAAMVGDTAAVKAALAKGADPNAKSGGRPALVWAAQNGWTDVVRMLIAAKANVNLRDEIDLTPLERAVDVGSKPEIVAMLIAAGADVNLKYGQPGKAIYPRRTVLMMAASSGQRPIVEMLLKAKADPNATDEAGDTALTIAVSDDHPELIPLLVKAGANVNVAKQYAGTPLFYAIDNGKDAALEALLLAGANPNTAGPNGQTPLMLAVDRNLPAVVAKLIAAKADVNAKDAEGATALDSAKRAGNDQIVEILAKAGAK